MGSRPLVNGLRKCPSPSPTSEAPYLGNDWFTDSLNPTLVVPKAKKRSSKIFRGWLSLLTKLGWRRGKLTAVPFQTTLRLSFQPGDKYASGALCRISQRARALRLRKTFPSYLTPPGPEASQLPLNLSALGEVKHLRGPAPNPLGPHPKEPFRCSSLKS